MNGLLEMKHHDFGHSFGCGFSNGLGIGYGFGYCNRLGISYSEDDL